jgi:hypothetical protein
MKLKVFMWQAYHDRLQTGVAMKSKKLKGNLQCTLCGTLETGDHLFFKCILSGFIWASFKEALGWERAPDSLQDILDNWIPLGCSDYKFKIFVLGVVLWAIWVTRNKIAIEGVAPKSPTDVLHKIHSFLQKWRALLGAGEQKKVDDTAAQLQGWMKKLREELRSRSPTVDFI